MNKDYEKAKRQVEEIRKIKIDSLVRARKGELWIKEYSEELSSVNNNYNNTRARLKELFKIKRLPWWVHVVVHTKIFFHNPIKYFTERPNYKKVMIDAYWEFKRLKKEWEDDFDFTEEAIDRDYKVYEESSKTLEKMESLLKRWERKMKLKRKYK
jgi:hypothetical protein